MALKNKLFPVAPKKGTVDPAPIMKPLMEKAKGGEQSSAQAAPGGSSTASVSPVNSTPTDLNAPSVQALPEQMDVKPSVPKYLSSWDKGFFPSINSERGKQIPIVQAMADYNKWAKDTGNEPLDMISAMTALQGRDPNKSIADNEEADRKARSNERWERIGNVLSHLGNFVGATAFGAPSQQLESGQELSNRQKQLRDATIAMREKRGNQLASLYQTELAQKRAAEKDANALYLAKRKQDLDEMLAKANLKLTAAKTDTERKKAEAAIEKTQAEINRINELLPYDVGVKKSQMARNYNYNSKKTDNNAWRQQLDEDFARLAEEHQEEYEVYEEKYGIGKGQDKWDKNKGKRWDDNLKRQFVAEMKRRKSSPTAPGDTSKKTMPGVKDNNKKMPGVK